MPTVAAIDLGASNGRLLLFRLEDGKLSMQEIHRFENEGIGVHGRLYWDILYLYRQILHGLQKAFAECPDLAAFGIDTWGVDFGLLDENGELLGSPHHYRDSQADGMIQQVEGILDRQALFNRTGVQDMWFNTVYQLMGMQKRRHSALAHAKGLLPIPDLLGYMLTGSRQSEYTTASTTQLYRVEQKMWDRQTLQRLGLDALLLPEVLPTGSIKGTLLPQLSKQLGGSSIPLVATAQHDSASAALAVPSKKEDYLFINSGTWSILGVVMDKTVLSDEIYNMGFSNEGAAFGRVKLVNSIMGMWLVQECRRMWRRQGLDVSFANLDEQVRTAPQFATFIDCEHPLFISPPDMPAAIDAYCESTGQPAPKGQGGYMRCIAESLALKYKRAIRDLEKATQRSFGTVHLLGGASLDANLCSFVACATNKRVLAGPVEATAMGNALAQFVALGSIGTADIPQLVLDSTAVTEYIPADTAQWEEAYRRYVTITQYGQKQRKSC